MNKLLFLILLMLSLLVLTSLLDPAMVSGKWERPQMQFPKDNPLSDASVDLGSALFSETLLSRDTSISCQTCHMTDVAFADHLPLGEGIKGRHVTRNTPTLFNIGYHPYFMFDGKFKTLEEQVLGPINEHREFDMSPDEVAKRVKNIPLYNALSQKAYNQDISIEVIQKAIANFERIMIADNSRFDQFKRNEIELTEQEMTGWELFNNSELNCSNCHNGYNFTNYAFENNGLYESYQDIGRELITGELKDKAKFKVPTLRNIAITYPYMHDGSLNTLEEVVDHYASGGKQHSSQSQLIKGFKLSSYERKALIEFLKTLTENRLVKQD